MMLYCCRSSVRDHIHLISKCEKQTPPCICLVPGRAHRGWIRVQRDRVLFLHTKASPLPVRSEFLWPAANTTVLYTQQQQGGTGYLPRVGETVRRISALLLYMYSIEPRGVFFA